MWNCTGQFPLSLVGVNMLDQGASAHLPSGRQNHPDEREREKAR